MKATEQEAPTERQIVIELLRTKKLRLSYSTVKKFTSPISLINYLVEKRTKTFVKTESMMFGTCCDLELFTPHEFDDKISITDGLPTTDNMLGFSNELILILKLKKKITDADALTAFSHHYKSGNVEKTYQHLKKYIEAKATGKEVASKAQAEESKNLIGALKRHHDVEDLLSQISETQMKIEWEYEGWKHIGYMDAYLQLGHILDGKYTKDSEPDKFMKDIYNLKYHLQAGMYCFYLIQAGITQVPKFTFLTYDRSLNYSIIKMDLPYIKYGIREYQYLVEKMNQMIEKGGFHSSYGFFKKEYVAWKPNWARGFSLDGE